MTKHWKTDYYEWGELWPQIFGWRKNVKAGRMSFFDGQPMRTQKYVGSTADEIRRREYDVNGRDLSVTGELTRGSNENTRLMRLFEASTKGTGR